jgi:hypothetical protein
MRGRGCSRQDLGDGVWLVLAALLPRTAETQVPPLPDPPPLVPIAAELCGARLCASCAWCGLASSGGEWQVSRDGNVRLVSGVGAKGTSVMALGYRRGLGHEGTTWLAETMREAPPRMLTKLDIRQCLLTSSTPESVAPPAKPDMHPHSLLAQAIPHHGMVSPTLPHPGHPRATAACAKGLI